MTSFSPIAACILITSAARCLATCYDVMAACILITSVPIWEGGGNLLLCIDLFLLISIDLLKVSGTTVCLGRSVTAQSKTRKNWNNYKSLKTEEYIYKTFSSFFKPVPAVPVVPRLRIFCSLNLF